MDREALFYGDALFETVCVKEGRGIGLLRHIQRFTESAAFFGFSDKRIREGISALEALDAGKDGLWRITVARDADVVGTHRGGVNTTFRVLPEPTSPRLTLCPNTFFPADFLARHKTTSYGRNMYARRFAEQTGYDDSLMVSADGRVGEASMANAFFVFNDHIATAPLDGILSGTRRAAALGCMDVRVREILAAELAEVRGIVLTSAAGIRAARSLDGRSLDLEVLERFQALEANL